MRSRGADGPRGDPRRAHGLPFEGYYWRFTDAAAGRVVVALAGVQRDAAGATWGNVSLVEHPGGRCVEGVAAPAWADPRGLGVRVGDLLEAAPDRVRVALPGAGLEVRVAAPVPWPGRRRLGALGAGHLVPGLSQYWHPWLLGGSAAGRLELGGDRIALDGASAYAEKNWGGGFPELWWWGQAQAFERPDVCVAFAGGRATLGPLGLLATAVVVRLGSRVLRLVRPPLPVAVRDRGWRLRASGPRWAVEVEGDANGSRAHVLGMPVPDQRRTLPTAHQHLAGRLRVQVREGRRVRFAGESLLAGLERGDHGPLAPRAPDPGAHHWDT